jgi:hypothetical protein
MATINIISTAYPVNDTINTVNQLPFTFTDTLRVGYPISFTFNLTYLNQLRQSVGVFAISSTDINTNKYSLQVFLFNSVDGSNNLLNITTNVLYSLSSTNLLNNILSQNLYGANKTFTMCHEDLSDIMTQTEVMQLSKLEDAKQKGVLNLDHLKRKNKDAKSSNAINEPPKAISTNLSNPSLMPAMFNKKTNNILKPIDFNQNSSPKAS